MSGIHNSASNESNSNLPDASARTFPTSVVAQTGLSGAAPNDSGNVQGVSNIYGGYNRPRPYSLLTSTGLQSVVQRAQGSVSPARYTRSSLPNATSQPSRGQSSILNTGGPGVLPNMGKTWRVVNSTGGPVRVDNSIRGSSSANVVNVSAPANVANVSAPANVANVSAPANVANIPAPANVANISAPANVANISAPANVANIPVPAPRYLKAPQMVSMPGNSYPRVGVPVTQNQVQAGNNQFSYTALLNDPNTPDSASLDPNDASQLSENPNSASGSQGHLDYASLIQKHNIGYNHQNQEFSMQNEDFPALPGYKGGINIGNGAEYSSDVSNMMQSQPLSVGRSSGYNFGVSYPSYLQQQPSSSINSGGVSHLPSGSQDLHFHGPEQYQHFQSSQSFFANQYPNNEMFSSLFQYPKVPDKYGLLGLLDTVKSGSSSWNSLGLGIDLTTLGLNLSSPEPLYKTFASPWTGEPLKLEPEITVPDCYNVKQPPQLTKSYFAKFRVETLLYIFYSMPRDEAQLFAANELYNRGWFHHRELRFWFMPVKDMEPSAKTSTHERSSYYIFDPNTWQTVRKDNVVLQYDLVEQRPVLPQR